MQSFTKQHMFRELKLNRQDCQRFVAVFMLVPGFEKHQERVFCRVVQGQWQDSEGCSLSSPPKKTDLGIFRVKSSRFETALSKMIRLHRLASINPRWYFFYFVIVKLHYNCFP